MKIPLSHASNICFSDCVVLIFHGMGYGLPQFNYFYSDGHSHCFPFFAFADGTAINILYGDLFVSVGYVSKSWIHGSKKCVFFSFDIFHRWLSKNV